MIVHEPEIVRLDGRVRVQARVESADARLAGLDRLWFEVDEARGAGVSDRADAFVVAVLPVAMAMGESVEVRGRTSPRLAWGAREFQQVHHAWWPRQARVVDVRYAVLEAPSAAERGAGVASSFSGGVDSLHTVWQHTGGREAVPGFGLTHALMINGFDLDLDLGDTGRFDALRTIYGGLLASLGVELVTVRTNLRAFRVAGAGPSGVFHSFGTALTASALALSRAFGRFYLAGANGYGKVATEGSHPITDHLLATESFHTIYDGGGAPTRFGKIAVVAAWPDALARLRVCSNTNWRNVDVERGVVDNCGACVKCARTMTSLEILSARTTFPIFRRPLTSASIRRGARTNRNRALENLREAVARGRRDIAFDLRCGLAQEPFHRWLRALRARAP